ncbi:MAG: NRDE family protein [Acidobacteriota bacterium]
MCTVSWCSAEDGGYELFFNRDELRSRRPALPPRRIERDGVEILTPVDADAGGSWLTSNAYGVTVALLNRYGVKAPAKPDLTPRRSRGQLVLDLASGAGRFQVTERLRRFDLGAYPPFTLLVLEVGRGPVTAAWDGRRLDPVTAPDPPLVSSSYDVDLVTRSRLDLWRRTVDPDDADTLAAFHRSHWPTRGAASPCMHRDDARTVSSTHLRVTAGLVEMRYADGPPCRTAYGEAIGLPRLHAATAA